MKVLLSWLREFAPIEGEPVALGEAMSDLGMAVESIDRVGEGLDGIVVARVLALRPHPNAERIQLVDVDLGDGEALQICCGAFNMAVGDLVPLAMLGTKMPNGMTIERRKLRGEWSNGMLCSAREIGLGDDHEGILVLDGDPALGTELKEALGIDADVLYDLEINPNRPDAMSVAGVARDLAARLGVPFALPDLPSLDELTATSPEVHVEILAPDLCGRFYARVLHDVAIGPSAPAIASRLLALGMRPINNVVDASNFVMLELGQPSHTYDLATLPRDSDGRAGLRTRWARDGEALLTLDGIERALVAKDGVITDGADAVIGLAGVMGGASTEISGSTTSVLLEMAWWDQMTIARTSKRLNLRSEASARFERGSDPEVAERAAHRFAELLAPSGARLTSEVADVRGGLPGPATVRLRTARVNAMLGTELSTSRITELLTPIGFAVTLAPGAADEQDVAVPSFRPDTATEIDVIEEVARHFGYANIRRTLPTSPRQGRLTPRQIDRRLVRQAMLGLGLDEAMPLAFLAPGDLPRSGLDDVGITLSNPLVAEESVLRTSLRPGLLQAVAYNASHRNDAVGLFEVGHIFLPPLPDQPLPDEREALGVIAADRDAFAAVEAWTVLAAALGLRGARLDQLELPGLHPARAATIVGRAGGDDVTIGELGEIDPAVLDRYGIAGRVAWLGVDLDRLLALPHGGHAYEPVSRFPSSDIDLAFVVPDWVPAGAVRETIEATGGPLLVSVLLFDVFRDASVGADARSLAFRLRFQAPDRTLTDDDVAHARAGVITAVESAHGASLRG